MTQNSSLSNPQRNDSQLPTLPPSRQLAHRVNLPAKRPADSPSSGTILSPAFLWRVFCQSWKWTVPAGILLAVIAAVAVMTQWVPKYESAALVKIQSNAPFIAFEQGRYRHEGDLYVQTQIELLRGPVVLAGILELPDVASIAEIKQQADPIQHLQKNLTIRQEGKSELYRVSYVSKSPQDAAAVANAVVAVYLRMQKNEERQRSEAVIDVLETATRQRGDKVEELRRQVMELTKELDPLGLGIVTDERTFTPAAAIHQAMTEAVVELEVLKAQLRSLEDAPILAADKAAAAGLLDLEVSAHPDVQQLQQQLDEVEQAISLVKNMRRSKIGDTWEKDPDYHRLREMATQKEDELSAVREAVRDELVQQHHEQRRAERERMKEQKLQEIAALTTRHEMLRQKLDEHTKDLKSGGAQSTELEFAKAELAREQKVFELIAARKLALQTEMRAPARVDLIDSARPPLNSIEPIPFKHLLLACVVALVAPFGAAVAHGLIARRIGDSDQLRQETALPLLGEVARFPTRQVSGKGQESSHAKKRELHVYAESIESLRTNLRLTENVGLPGHPKVVAVCSARSGEGKTSMATALAMSIAEATRQPTLVLDADLRAPDVTNLFDVPKHPGLAEVLSGSASPAEAIHRVGKTETNVMPAGKCRVNPHQLLHGQAIDDLLIKLREQFLTIVIDTPPVLAASESLVYAKAADLVVFCSLCDVSRVKQVQNAIERLQATGANLAGAVLNGVSLGRYVYHYGVYHPQS